MPGRELFFFFPGNDVRPQRVDIGGLEHIAPRGHVSHAVGHGIDEARAVLPRKFTQILGPLRIGEARPVTRLAVGFVERRTLPDLFGSERLAVLRHGAGAREREAEGAAQSHAHSGIKAKVHTAPPVGTLSVTTRFAMLPPRPERTVTYCRPLWV